MGRSGEGADLAAIEAVYRRRVAELRRVATAITASREAGCDAVQDAFALAIRRRGQFRGEGSLEAWLWRILVRTARDASAADRRRRSSASLDDAPELEAHGSEEVAHQRDLQRLVATLPERQRLALFLRYYADLDYPTIADALEISGGTVGALLNQARENLRRMLAEVTS